MKDWKPQYTYVARQPILDRRGRTYGYELLYRESLENAVPLLFSEEKASLKVLVDAFLHFGVQELTFGKRAFINFTEKLLFQGIPKYFRPNHLVIEILERIPFSTELEEVCRELYKQGYALALDDFRRESPLARLIPYVRYIKVDFRDTPPEEIISLAKELKNGHYLVAEKVETPEEFEWARELGFHLFQGFYFARPKVLSQREIPVSKKNYLHLLKLLQSPEDNLEEITEIIKVEPSLSLKLLRYINSAFFAFPQKIRSIKQAAILLGKSGLRKWGSLVTLFLLAADQPPELIIQSIARAEFMKLLSQRLGLEDQAEDAFLAGLFSLLEAITEQPLPVILQELTLEDDIRKALLGEPGLFTPLLLMVKAYEQGDWDNLQQLLAEFAPFLRKVLPEIYQEALRFAHEAFNLSVQ